MSSSPVNIQDTDKSSSRIFRAPWVVPVTSPILQDGAVVADRNSIHAVGSFYEISSLYPHLPIVPCQGVLLPALVNAHIHLDLSVFGTVQPDSHNFTMCDWIQELLRKRESVYFTPEELHTAVIRAIGKQHASGVGLMLDIGNSVLQSDATTPIEILSLLETLGPSHVAQQAVIESISNLPPDQQVTGHAPYSTGPDLLRFIKDRCRQQDTIFSLHLAENIDEALLLTKGEGCFATFLRERGGWDETFPVAGIDSRGVVGYLDDLKILDKRTLCVHCVHLTDREISELAESGAHICLCPGSNRFLAVGTAPLEKILAAGILPALGTDSITSNPHLDLWREMNIVAQDYPAVDPAIILRMAILGGAKALHRDDDFGSLEPGKSSHFLHVQGKSYEEADTPEQLLKQLTSSGHPESVSWVWEKQELC